MCQLNVGIGIQYLEYIMSLTKDSNYYWQYCLFVLKCAADYAGMNGLCFASQILQSQYLQPVRLQTGFSGTQSMIDEDVFTAVMLGNAQSLKSPKSSDK